MSLELKSTRKWMIVGLLLLAALLVLAGCTSPAVPAPTQGAADPQRLLIPRWFLSGLTLDGTPVEVAADQQSVTIQFQEDGNVNGKGGCNEFSATYSATADGKMAFGPVVSTKMACDPGMELENAYFQALSKVERFSTENGLVLSSADGKTSITLRMPPK